MRRTKIVCTIGPASADEGVLRQLLRAGMDVARLNFSHGDLSTHAQYVARLRRLAREEGSNLAILQDLQGPRLRIGALSQPEVQLEEGQAFTLTSRPVTGDAREVSVEGVALAREVHPGSRVLVDDGQIELVVLKTTDTDVVCRVVDGGALKPRKGINVPGITLSVPTITDKDREDLAFGVGQGVDFVAMSFVRSAADVNELKRLLADRKADIPVIAKIEKHEAVTRFDEILAAADGIMVARGDLGVETSVEEVPVVQKMAIAKCNAAGKPVITATQMLNSMIEEPRPTRAEASDVANAIFDGSDAVMLSGETAVGRYPVLAVQTMARIAVRAEEAFPYADMLVKLSATTPGDITDAIGQATVQIAHDVGAKAIVSMTSSGFTARMVARHRPSQPIVAITKNETTQRRLALTWGTTARLVPPYETLDELFLLAERSTLESGLAGIGDLVVITAGLPMGLAGRTSLLNVHRIGEFGAGR